MTENQPDEKNMMTLLYGEIKGVSAQVSQLAVLVASKADVDHVNTLSERITSVETKLEHRSKVHHDLAQNVGVFIAESKVFRDQIRQRVESLEKADTADEAVRKYRKWLLSGGGLVFVLIVVQILVAVVLLEKGASL